MSSIAHFWYWVHNTAKPALRAQDWYNGEIPLGQRGFLWDRTSRIMGYATLRQLRIKPPGKYKMNYDSQIYASHIYYISKQ